MSDLGGDAGYLVTRSAIDLSRETAKMTNEAVKAMLVVMIDKAKEQGNKPGEKSLMKLLKSNDEIKMFDIHQHQLKEFAEKAKKFGIAYAVIEDDGRHSIFYKLGDEARVKMVIENLINRSITEQGDPAKQDKGYEIVGDSQIEVPDAVLDVSNPIERKLAEEQGIDVEAIITQNQRQQLDYEVTGESSIKVYNAELDLDDPVQRELADQEGIKVEEVLQSSRQSSEQIFTNDNNSDNNDKTILEQKERLLKEAMEDIQMSYHTPVAYNQISKEEKGSATKYVYEMTPEGEPTVETTITVDPEAFQRKTRIFIDEPLDKEGAQNYQRAIDLAKEAGEISLAQIREEINVGMGEANSIIRRMEHEGLISDTDSSKVRPYIAGDLTKAPEISTPSPEQNVTPIVEFLRRNRDRNAVGVDEPNSSNETIKDAPTQQGTYEQLEGTKIRVPSVTLDMNKPEHRQLAESYGIKVNEIDFKRDMYEERKDTAERESLSERIGEQVKGSDRDNQANQVPNMLHDMHQRVEGRKSLEERRNQIRPLVAAQQAPPAKNKNREVGGR